ncbi:hypothetical protein TNCV_2525741 [Trichonephila clavipes]|nr:hypothetical protein TNCV_2525741 [Trichonephila clavipes]
MSHCSQVFAVQKLLDRLEQSMVYPNSNPTTVVLQAGAGLVSKHNAVPFRCPCLPFISPLVAQTLTIYRCSIRYFSVRACDTHVSSFFTMPMAAKRKKIDWDATDNSDPSCCAIDFDRAWLEWSTLQCPG